MAHDPSLGFADYFSAADATAASVATLMPTMEDGAPELFCLHTDMEYLGMRGLAAMPGAASAAAHSNNSKAALIDPGADGSSNTTMRFLSAGQQHHHQPSQAPLSLSLCRPDGVGVTLHQHLGGSSRQQQLAPAAWMHDYSVPQGQHAGAWHPRSSRFLLPAQQLLQEFCSLPVDTSATKRTKAATTKPSSQQQAEDGGDGSSSSASWAPSPQIQAMDALELQRLKDKLYIMLEEVDRRYRRYCEQMRSLAGGFEVVAGERASAAYTALASRTISRHFRNLRDGIVAQLQAVRKALGEKDVAVPGMTRGETPRLRVLDQCIRQQKALNQPGMMESHPWRPQRGLPERAVTILRAWLFEHFLHPYPSDVDKHILARRTGLSRSQVSNWFINARVRLWKPMIEEMYVEEMKGDQDGSSSRGQQSLNPNQSCSHASEAHGACGGHAVDEADGGYNGDDRKPTRAQLLHDAGSLASIVNIGGVPRLENFGIMDHLDFDAYDGGQQGSSWGRAGGGVSLTLGLQQHDSHDSGVNIAFGAPPSAHHGGAAGYLFTAGGQMEGGMHPEHGHHVQFGVAIDGETTPHGQEQYRNLGAGFHLLRDLAG
ncbi:homeobox protein BEL1 homolog [Phragmites australis]|uniref:homeobox protein BEL1 homolog n=1 Tax=Phragmites australis TaxID=29695 RepID=UPI002D7A1ED8|nr:homeobox protein BEL1 homolog [Phragmites australis]XP_062216960.1 homeobox protein BEL1 homolog [Phragmites australis]XP_062216961.1 homeobox protein BEL1 homolog [Phragmites australis]XP_062216962.1 homeobox protein BEL1 homolog [Phragmites australis]XP_062216964.1 homeobox protein BEL1 homolog [Phragmites australis]XP_062216965.1 homeobox protein BEL1 homolog [Phragmites australis]